MNATEQAVKILAERLTVTDLGDGLIKLHREDLVNPADVRAMAAMLLSEAGFEAYSLKEVYAYMGSKKPYRTDSYGCVEFTPWDSFSRNKIKFKNVGNVPGPGKLEVKKEVTA